MIPDPTLYLFVCIGLFVAGTFAGRFLNRCILRIPFHFHVLPAWKSVFSTEKRYGVYPQTCWYHYLPVIGTASIVGRSPFSGRRILAREPWLELLNGALWIITFLCVIPPESWGALEADCLRTPLWAGEIYRWNAVTNFFLWARYFYFILLIEALFVATFIDFDYWIIPDGVTVPAMFAGVIGQVLGVGFFVTPVWYQDHRLVASLEPLLPWLSYWPTAGKYPFPEWILSHPTLHALAVSVVGFIVGGGIVWAVRIVGGKVLQKEAMGFGDVILMAMVGTFVGWQPVVIAFFLAAILALAIFAVLLIVSLFFRQEFTWAIPYGPYLSAATILTILGWKYLWPVVDWVFMMGPLLIVFAAVLFVLLVISLLLVQGVKWLCGIDPWPEDELSWRASDQLFHFSGETVDLNHSQWKRAGWQGKFSGRGQINEQQWRGDCHSY